jgi:hypothetical protein
MGNNTRKLADRSPEQTDSVSSAWVAWSKFGAQSPQGENLDAISNADVPDAWVWSQYRGEFLKEEDKPGNHLDLNSSWESEKITQSVHGRLDSASVIAAVMFILLVIGGVGWLYYVQEVNKASRTVTIPSSESAPPAHGAASTNESNGAPAPTNPPSKAESSEGATKPATNGASVATPHKPDEAEHAPPATKHAKPAAKKGANKEVKRPAAQ